MVAVTTGEVSVVPAGIVYCAVIATCVDVRRPNRVAELGVAAGRHRKPTVRGQVAGAREQPVRCRYGSRTVSPS